MGRSAPRPGAAADTAARPAVSCAGCARLTIASGSDTSCRPRPDRLKIAALGGTLRRDDDGTWAWSDGTSESRVRDMTLAWCYNFRLRNRGQLVEVPRGMARENADLAWVEAGLRAGTYRTGYDGDSVSRAHLLEQLGGEAAKELTGRTPATVVLVPREDFDARPPCGVTWDREHEAEILAKARALGWQG